MNLSLLLHTICHLRLVQVWYQIKSRAFKSKYVLRDAPSFFVKGLMAVPIPREHCLDGDVFSFVNLDHGFAGWNYDGLGSLWTYNQNYFDWLNQEGAGEEGVQWIDRFIDEVLSCPEKAGMSLDSYPIALRSINWIKFFCRYPGLATKKRLDSLYSQLRLLEKKLEYHILGNHLLEDSYALYFGASFFSDQRLLNKAERLLMAQLKEQILPDGANFEQSPMYHCILLDRLLDCINVRRTDELEHYAKRMLGYLDSIAWEDGTIPLLNDSAWGIAPAPKQIFDYARRLGINWEPVRMSESGYRKMTDETMEAIVDVGDITATYQPGHSHADTFNYVLRIDGKPIVVDTGISTYNKTERRQLERSTIAHNTVVVNGKNSSEVWGGFRVGRRAKIVNEKEDLEEKRGGILEATHNGYKGLCRRRFEMKGNHFVVEDWFDGEAVSYIHLAKDVDENRIMVEDALSIEIKPWKYSVEYNRFLDGKVMAIRFKGHCRYSIH